MRASTTTPTPRLTTYVPKNPHLPQLSPLLHTKQRPADWHPKAIEKTLFENRTHQAPYGEIVVALTRYAKDSDKRVPSFLFDALADWHEPGTVAPKNPCEDHGFPAHNCHSCKADILVGDRPPELMGKHHEIPITGLD